MNPSIVQAQDNAPGLYEARLVVTRVVWDGASASIFLGDDEWGRSVRVVGQGFEVLPGEAWHVQGEWREHPEHGPQLHAEADGCVRAPPPHPLISAWLTQFDGVGPQRAQAIAEKLSGLEGGLDTAFGGAVPVEELAAAVAPDRPFMAARIAAEIVARWGEVRAEYETLRWLEGAGVADARVARKLVRLMGPGARELLEQDPYVLSAMLPWRTVDAVGVRILAAKGAAPDTARCRWVGAVESVLRDQVADGHTAIRKGDLARKAWARLVPKKARPARETSPGPARLADAALRHGVVVDGGAVWRVPGCAMMEDEIEDRLSRIAADGGNEVRVPPRPDLERLLAKRLGGWGRLAGEQRDAVSVLLGRPVGALTGGAGVGKTTTCRALCDAWEMLGGRVELCALSGKAALRLSESTKRRALTIHRLLRGLERRRDEAEKGRPPSNDLPLLDAWTLLVVDEASMVDLPSMHLLVEAMGSGCRLLLVGDPFQLPPVGFGLPFHGLAGDSAISFELRTVRRQTEASGIPAVTRSIREERRAPFGAYEPMGEGVGWRELADAEDVRFAVDRLVQDAGGFGEADHRLIIVAATNEVGPASALNLNRQYHDKRRIECDLPEVKGHLGQWFSPGDPVVHLSNDYTRDLYNGSLGRVASVDTGSRTLHARFGERELEFTRAQMLDLGLAYALTCHRLQGSQVERVLVPVTRAAPVDPSWLYTAITRAETQAVLVGSSGDLDAIMARPIPQETLIAKRLKISSSRQAT